MTSCPKKQYFYRIKSNVKGIGQSTCIWGTDMEDAWQNIIKRHNIQVVHEFYSEGSMFEGMEWRRYFAIDGHRVNIEVCPYP